MSLERECRDIALHARGAARLLATARGECKDAWLAAAADALSERRQELLDANRRDLDAAAADGLSGALIDRLTLTPQRVESMVRALSDVRALPDPIGEIVQSSRRPNGLQVAQTRVPLGVVFFLYESRPNVTTDAAALCLKSGNAVILRGGKEARHTNLFLARVLRDALSPCGLPADAVQIVETTDRDAVGHFLKLEGLIDLVIPRGGESLIRRVVAEAAMPVLKHYQGNCHVYIDASADPDMAARIVHNSKVQRPGVCNAAETLLVHRAVAPEALPRICADLAAAGVELRGDEASRALFSRIKPAQESDWDTEYLDLILAVRVVESLDEAVAHITRHGSGHTEAIVTRDLAAARRFTAEVDSSCVMVNASTRFNDGGQLGLGAEIGISTDKIHARGPCGLHALTSTKWIVLGDGHVRD